MLCVLATLYVYLYMCMCLHAYVWIGRQMEPGMIVHVYIISKFACTYLCVHLCTRICVYMCKFILYVYAHVRMYMCISMYVCICVYLQIGLQMEPRMIAHIFTIRICACTLVYVDIYVRVYMCICANWIADGGTKDCPCFYYTYLRMYACTCVCVDWMAGGAKNDCSRYQRSSHFKPSKYCQLIGTGSIFLHTHTHTHTHTRTLKQTHT